jgi:predicted DNA binding protein
MSFIAEILLSHRDIPLIPTLRSNPDLDVRAELQPMGDVRGIFYAVADATEENFAAALDEDYTVADWHALERFGDRRIYHVEFAPDLTLVVPAMLSRGIRVLDLTSHRGEWLVRVHVPERTALDSLREYCDRENVSFRLRKLYRTVDHRDLGDGFALELTDRQREVATVATEMGYFEPDGASAGEVADALDISKSTLSTHLRNVTAKVFRSLFRE